MTVYSKIIINAFKKYPLFRGMASYGVIWPISSLIQQTFEGKNIGKSRTYVNLDLHEVSLTYILQLVFYNSDFRYFPREM